MQYCAESGRLSRLVRMKVVVLHAFTVGFKKFIRVFFYFSWLFPIQLTFFCTVWWLLVWRFLLWFSLKRRQRYLTQKYFHSIPFLSWTLTLHLLFCSFRGSLYHEWKSTRTYTCTHKHTDSLVLIIAKFLKCALINVNELPSDFLMVLNYYRFYFK